MDGGWVLTFIALGLITYASLIDSGPRGHRRSFFILAGAAAFFTFTNL